VHEHVIVVAERCVASQLGSHYDTTCHTSSAYQQHEHADSVVGGACQAGRSTQTRAIDGAVDRRAGEVSDRVALREWSRDHCSAGISKGSPSKPTFTDASRVKHNSTSSNAGTLFSTANDDQRRRALQHQQQQQQQQQQQHASTQSSTTATCVRTAWRDEARALVISRERRVLMFDVDAEQQQWCALCVVLVILLITDAHRHDDAPLSGDVTALHVDRFAQRMAAGMSNGSCALIDPRSSRAIDVTYLGGACGPV
jgi:hypothetical protein